MILRLIKWLSRFNTFVERSGCMFQMATRPVALSAPMPPVANLVPSGWTSRAKMGRSSEAIQCGFRICILRGDYSTHFTSRFLNLHFEKENLILFLSVWFIVWLAVGSTISGLHPRTRWKDQIWHDINWNVSLMREILSIFNRNEPQYFNMSMCLLNQSIIWYSANFRHPETKAEKALLKTLGPKQRLGHFAVFRIVEVGSFSFWGRDEKVRLL